MQLTRRFPSLRYRKNEVFLDVVESVNLLVRPAHRFRIEGELTLASRRAGQPERERRSERDSRRGQDEVLPQRHARTTTRPQRQGHV